MDLNQLNRNHRIWQPHGWRDYSAAQQPSWEKACEVEDVESQLKTYPGLVSASEIESLKTSVADAARGQKFLLQGGDCAERFQDCREEAICAKMSHLLQMAMVIGFSGKKSVVPIGRMAGQYAKPRSEEFEILASGENVPVFRGDFVHSYDRFDGGRRANPYRMLQGYHCSSATLNFIRTQMACGLGDIRNFEQWNWDKLRLSQKWKSIDSIIDSLNQALTFMSQLLDHRGALAFLQSGFKEFFVSHEALLLPYEEAMTRFVARHGRYYNLSTHMVWIGDRTRQTDGAHVEYCRGIGNPIGIKIGANTNISDLISIIEKINPHHEHGKVVLITRLGREFVQDFLPSLIKQIQQIGAPVTWSVDPMHGNTYRVSSGRKTRRFEDIMFEIQKSFLIHNDLNSILGGVHLELTSDDVTECVGGAAEIKEEELALRYETWCDPRLNQLQSMEASFQIANCLRQIEVGNLAH